MKVEPSMIGMKPDFDTAGKQGAEMAHELLAGKKFSKVKPVFIEKATPLIRPAAAKALGIELHLDRLAEYRVIRDGKITKVVNKTAATETGKTPETGE